MSSLPAAVSAVAEVDDRALVKLVLMVSGVVEIMYVY